MSLAASALELASQGCRVFPIHPGEKKPAIKYWPKLATTNAHTLEKWWHKWPEHNPGIHTSGLFVVDVDGPEGHSLSAKLELPATIKSISGNLKESHHYQLFYVLPVGLTAPPKPLCKYPNYDEYRKIDIRSHGGQVVGPGSRHKSGGVYHWLDAPNNIYQDATAAVNWMIDLCKPLQINHQSLEPDDILFQTLVNRFPIKETGTRNYQQLLAVGWLTSKEISPDKQFCLLMKWLRNFAGKFSTSWDDCEEELQLMITRTQQEAKEGNFLLPPNHVILTAEQNIRPYLLQLLSMNKRTTEHLPTVDALPVACTLGRKLSDVQYRFLYSFFLHWQYKGEQKSFKMAHRQLMDIYQQKFKSALSWDSFYKCFDKFITRVSEGGSLLRAKWCEVAVLDKKGVIGFPSIYTSEFLWKQKEIYEERN